MPDQPNSSEQTLAKAFIAGHRMGGGSFAPGASSHPAMPTMTNMGGFAKTPAGEALVNHIMGEIMKSHGKVKVPSTKRGK